MLFNILTEKVMEVWENSNMMQKHLMASRVSQYVLFKYAKKTVSVKRAKRSTLSMLVCLMFFCFNVGHNNFTTLFVGTFTLIVYSNLMVSMLLLDEVPLFFIFREREFSFTINKGQRNLSGTRKFKATWSWCCYVFQQELLFWRSYC